MSVKCQEKDSDRCGGAGGFELCLYKYLHKEACIVQRKAAVVKYRDINKLARFVLKTSPRKERRERRRP